MAPKFVTLLVVGWLSTCTNQKEHSEIKYNSDSTASPIIPIWMQDDYIIAHNIVVFKGKIIFDSTEMQLVALKDTIFRELENHYLEQKRSEKISYTLLQSESLEYDDYKSAKNIIETCFADIWHKAALYFFDKPYDELHESQRNRLRNSIPMWINEGTQFENN